MEKENGNFWSVTCLVLLAPVLGELLSGSSPPAEYFQPLTFILLTALYGIGALLVRELARRWGTGWLSIFLLGMAYGIYEEGILVRSFFDPNWMDLGVLGEYGRVFGINWIWSIALTLFHASISISAPIVLVELAFPVHKDVPWLKKRGLVLCCIILLGLLVLSPFFSMYSSSGGILASIITIGVLVYIANNGSLIKRKQSTRRAVKPMGVFILFLFLMIGLIFGMWVFPSFNLPAWSAFMFLALLPWLALLFTRHMGSFSWDERHAWSAAFGLLLPWLLLSVAAEAQNGIRPDDTSGSSLAAAIMFILLIILRAFVYKRFKHQRDMHKR